MTGTLENGLRAMGGDKRRNAVFAYASHAGDGRRQITVGVSADTFATVDATARAHDLTNTAFCRRVLQAALAQPDLIEALLGGDTEARV